MKTKEPPYDTDPLTPEEAELHIELFGVTRQTLPEEEDDASDW